MYNFFKDLFKSKEERLQGTRYCPRCNTPVEKWRGLLICDKCGHLIPEGLYTITPDDEIDHDGVTYARMGVRILEDEG